MDPYVEFDLDVVRSHYYLFAIEFTLPASPVYGPLLFNSYYENGGTGYTVTLTDDHRLPLTIGCLPWTEQNVAFWTNGLRTVQHRCAKVLASDEDLEELARVRHIKIMLNGEYRQLWVDGIQLVFRNLVEKPPSPPGPPQSPYAPPQPKAPPDAPVLLPSEAGNCTSFFGQYKMPDEATVIMHEPCGQTRVQCCQHAYENGANGFQINGAGCCDLLAITTAEATTEDRSSVNRGWLSGRVMN
jgi:hypothetical protein